MAGLPRADLPTPALLLDLAALEHNIAEMASWTSANNVAIRPHAKIHKCPDISRRQLAAGAIGLTTATVYEAEAMLAAGPAEILIANEVVGPFNVRRLAEVARRATVIVAMDDAGNARQVSAAMAAADAEVGVLVDVNVGMQRCGVRSPAEAAALAGEIAMLPGLRLRGAMGYEGHVVLEKDRGVRAARANEAMDVLAAAVAAMEHAGHEIEIVSAGGTNTYDMTSLHSVVTELQAGTYALMDTGYAPFAPRFRPALSVASRVLSHQAGTLVVDCGTKAVAADLFPPGVAPSVGVVREVHEEHMLIDAAAGSALKPGDLVEVTVGYTGGTVNLHDGFYIINGGGLTDVWPILARGPGRRPAINSHGVIT